MPEKDDKEKAKKGRKKLQSKLNYLLDDREISTI